MAMKSIILLLAIVGYVHAISYADVLEEEWNLFKEEYTKSYETADEELLRKLIFQDHKKMIDRHNARFNAGEETYEMGVNQFTDLLPKEFESLMLSPLNETETEDQAEFVYSAPNDISLPASIDWRAKGAVTAVKNQGKCGSCWAFSAVGSLEGQYFLKTGKLVSLSAQNLVDCSSRVPFNNKGCFGGLPWKALQYININGGIDTEISYPYRGIQMQCRYDKRNIGATVKSVAFFKGSSESNLAAAVAIHGPISVCVDATKMQFYHSGVYNNPTCTTRLTHAMVVVGYGTDSHGGDYWLVKNSWGSLWGEKGYIRMSRNRNNQCGIASYAVLPLV